MKKHLFLIAAFAFALASCDSSFDLDNIENDVTLIPGATIEFPEGTETHTEIPSNDLIGLDGDVEEETSGTVDIPETEIETGYKLADPIRIDFKDAPEVLKASGSTIFFESAPVKIRIANPAPYPVDVRGKLKVGGKSLDIAFDLLPGAEPTEKTLDIATLIERIPDYVEIADVVFTKKGTKASAPCASESLTFNWSAVASFSMSFKPGTKLEFTYSFEDLAFDLSTLGVEVRAIDVKVKVSSTFPVTLQGSATDKSGGVHISLSKINANAVNQEVTIHATADNGVHKVDDIELTMLAVNETDGIVRIDDSCSLSVDLDSIVLPEGFKL